MNGNYFLDTNILVYLFDAASRKQVISQSLVLSSLKTRKGMISFQVAQEFLNLATGKFARRTKPEHTREFLQKVLFPLCQVFPDSNLLLLALDIQTETRFSFYDSLILASAAQGDCDILYTEDLQAGQKVRGVEIINPYIEGSQLPQ